MKNRKNILTCIVAALSILVTSASSSPAAPGQTYHGTLTGSAFYCNGEENPDFRPTVTGMWNLIIVPKISQRCFASLNMTNRAIAKIFCNIFYSRIDSTRLDFKIDIPKRPRIANSP